MAKGKDGGQKSPKKILGGEFQGGYTSRVTPRKPAPRPPWHAPKAKPRSQAKEVA